MDPEFVDDIITATVASLGFRKASIHVSDYQAGERESVKANQRFLRLTNPPESDDVGCVSPTQPLFDDNCLDVAPCGNIAVSSSVLTRSFDH